MSYCTHPHNLLETAIPRTSFATLDSLQCRLEYFSKAYRELNLQSHYTLLHIPDEENPENSRYEIYDDTRLVCQWDRNGGRIVADQFTDVFRELKRHIQEMKMKDGNVTSEFSMFEGRSLNSRTGERTSPARRRPSSPTEYRPRGDDSRQSVFRLRFSDLSDYELAFMISHASAEQLRRIHRKKSPRSPSQKGGMRAIENMLSPEELKHYREQKRHGKPLLPLQHSGDKSKYKHAIPMHDDDGSGRSKYNMPIPMDEPLDDGKEGPSQSGGGGDDEGAMKDAQ